mmetsp:Transcript_13926/g.21388  ORF Transcript_13926/g.21388 Transcript_13926/m.21388 type:complete len:334 (-) Transcript_13926:87-1088(-)
MFQIPTRRSIRHTATSLWHAGGEDTRRTAEKQSFAFKSADMSIAKLFVAFSFFFFTFLSVISFLPAIEQLHSLPTDALDAELKIPRHLVFTYKHNILETREPKHFYDNIHNIARKYKTGWASAGSENKSGVADEDVKIYFLDDQACISNITAAYQDLVPHFHAEKSGAFKADICRLAFLYLYGGYYFDVDVDVVEPFIPNPNVQFVTANDFRNAFFFQAILMTSPRHPIIKQALELELEHYERGLSPPVFKGLIGCDILKRAYHSNIVEYFLRGSDEQITLLDEIDLSPNAGHEDMYKHIERMPVITCNMVVHDPIAQHLFFKSRIAGSSNCP